MRRTRFRKQAVSVSLFPFLAVLICTMGALILLLVLVVKEADVQASERREEDSAALRDATEKLEIEHEDEEYRQRMLEGLRPKLTKRLADRRKELGHLEEQVRLLRQRAQQLHKEIEDLAQEDSQRSSGREALETELAQLNAALQDARQELDEAKTAAANRPRSFAIIPYEGPNGTRRRPVYIECTSHGVTFQPEGVTLRPRDFGGLLLPGNPLDAALLATREYLLRHHGVDSHGEPYPLLIVRPDGTAAYDLARRAMKSWDDEFGYELIDDDVELAYPKADPNLKQVLQQAIEDARHKQELLAKMQPSRFRGVSGGGGGEGFRNAPSGGGFVREGVVVPEGASLGTAGDQRTGHQSAPSLTRQRTDGRTSERAGQGGPADTATPGDRHQDSQTQGSQTGSPRDPRRQDGPRRQGDSQRQGGQPRGADRASSGTPGQIGHTATPHSVADTRGHNWALQQRTPGATAIRRPIRVVCLADRVVIVAERDSIQPTQEVPVRGAMYDSVDNIVSAVWTHIESWGTAGRNAFWKPELKVEVGRGGQQRFTELNALFKNSGFDVERVR